MATRVHLCCGTHIMKGWTNVDGIPFGQEVVADLSKPWAFAPPASVDEMYCKDGFEHFETGEFFLAQASNLLRPGGRIRLWVPHFKNPSAYRLTHRRLISWNFWDVYPEPHDAVRSFRVVENRIYIGAKESRLWRPIHWLINLAPRWWERLFYVSNVEVVLERRAVAQ